MKINKRVAILISVTAVFATAGVVSAQPTLIPAQVNTPQGPVSVVIPAHAVEVTPGVLSLGTSVDNQGREVQGFILFHHREGHGGGPSGASPGGGGNSSQCYALMAKDTSWKTPEAYQFNPANNDGLSSDFVENAFTTGIAEWENNAGNTGIFGTGSATTATLEADFDAPDDINEVYFGSIEDPNVLAFTLVWGIFNGPPFARELVSWDMVFNDNFAWGDATINAALWDLENVTVHELGHAAGLTHPENTCTEETMYAFASVGETKKRDLNDGDITGINKLY